MTLDPSCIIHPGPSVVMANPQLCLLIPKLTPISLVKDETYQILTSNM